MGKWWRNRDRIRVSGNEALLVELERIRDEDDRQNKRIAVIEEDTKAMTGTGKPYIASRRQRKCRIKCRLTLTTLE